MKARPSPPGSTHCRRCRKAIMWPGLCYTCATGRPRQLVAPLIEPPQPAPGQAVEPRGQLPAS